MHKRPTGVAQPPTLLKGCQDGQGPTHPLTPRARAPALPRDTRQLTIAEAIPVLTAPPRLCKAMAYIPRSALRADAITAPVLLPTRVIPAAPILVGARSVTLIRAPGLLLSLAIPRSVLITPEIPLQTVVYAPLAPRKLPAPRRLTSPRNAPFQEIWPHLSGQRHPHRPRESYARPVVLRIIPNLPRAKTAPTAPTALRAHRAHRPSKTRTTAQARQNCAMLLNQKQS